jgi:glycosyltransferase involved in cell wall biosynthesis
MILFAKSHWIKSQILIKNIFLFIEDKEVINWGENHLIILFLTLGFPKDKNASNLYVDLMQEFIRNGNDVYVACQNERRYKCDTLIQSINGINVLRIKTGNITKTNIAEKAISTFTLESNFIKAIKVFLPNVKFDLCIYSTPPITFERVVTYIKNKNNCPSYLLLKDIFPQNAVDLEIIKKGGFLWTYLRAKERRLYNVSDYIGCMSKGNVNYILKHNPNISPDKIEVCPNSICPIPQKKYNIKLIRHKYEIPIDSMVFIYGGSLGKPQGIDFFKEVLLGCVNRKDIYFLIAGTGTEYIRLENFLSDNKIQNAKLVREIASLEYHELLGACDVGLIFLDKRFTIPNFPSRFNSYLEHSMPCIAATDTATDIKDVIKEASCGFWVESGDTQGFISAVDTLTTDFNLRKSMGINARKYLEQHFTVSKSYDIIAAHFGI